jgi:membrane-bound serine protease (ClpP class)
MIRGVVVSFLLFAACIITVPAQAGVIYRIDVDGIINPASAGFIEDGIEEAEEAEAACLVIQMDTPGGLMESMRSIVKRMMSSQVPIIVYVAPSAARAGSAGVFITLAAHIAAMAPGTNIGAATPVQMGEKKMSEEMQAKILNDTVAFVKTISNQRGRNAEWAEKAVREGVSATEEEALKLGVIDLVSPTLEELLTAIDGRSVTLAAGNEVILDTKEAEIRPLTMSFRERLLDIISNPNIAYILLMLGIYGLFFELYNPGVILPGVIGGICLILAFFAFQMLSVNYAGVALIVLGIIMFILELKIASYGALSIGGVIALLIGSIMLIESPADYLRISFWNFILPVVVVSAGFFLLALTLVVRTHRRRPTTGKEGLIGAVGIARDNLRPEGLVEIHGELWSARADQEIRAGERIKVTGLDALKITVSKE